MSVVVVAQEINIEEKKTADEISSNIAFRLMTSAQEDEWKENAEEKGGKSTKTIVQVSKFQ